MPRFFLLTVCLCALTARVFAATPTAEMVAAANNYLAALDPDRRAKSTYEFQNTERVNWHFIPRERKGLPFKEMTPAQQRLATALVSSGLSHSGMAKVHTIMSLEQILKEVEAANPGPVRDPERYFITIFGTPSTNGVWGWRLEGHHLAFNFTFDGEKGFSGTPNFLGSNPGEVRTGQRQGLRTLALEEDLGRALITSLDLAQQNIAIITNVAPKEIVTANDRSVKNLEPRGISYAKLNKAQKEQLLKVVKEYAGRIRAELAEADMKKIGAAGLDKISFAWAGSLKVGEGHYYRIQGPTFLIEYDNTQNNANHVHAVWRDLANDFGDDLLAKHYAQEPHAK